MCSKNIFFSGKLLHSTVPPPPLSPDIFECPRIKTVQNQSALSATQCCTFPIFLFCWLSPRWWRNGETLIYTSEKHFCVTVANRAKEDSRLLCPVRPSGCLALLSVRNRIKCIRAWSWTQNSLTLVLWGLLGRCTVSRSFQGAHGLATEIVMFGARGWMCWGAPKGNCRAFHFPLRKTMFGLEKLKFASWFWGVGLSTVCFVFFFLNVAILRIYRAFAMC